VGLRASLDRCGKSRPPPEFDPRTQIGIKIENLSHEISKYKEYADSKINRVSGEIQDIKQHSATEISRLSATLGDLQAKLVTETSDRTSPAFPVRGDVRSVAVQQVDSVINTAGSNNAERMV
jgi:hypothetical protein